MDIDKRKVIKYFLFAVTAVWFLVACRSLFLEIQLVGRETWLTRGMDNERRREVVYGNFYRFISACNAQIPENANVLLVTDSLFEYYYVSYYLYPRRVLVNSPDKPVDGLNAANISLNPTREFLMDYNIAYIAIPRYQGGDFRIFKVNP